MKSWSEKFNGLLKPITDYQRKYIRDDAQKFIFVFDKDGNGKCTKCESNVKVIAKHHDYTKCPSCGKEMKVHHTWRTQRNPEVDDWYAIAKAIDNHTLCLRYFNIVGESITERGRIYIDEYRSGMEFWCNSPWYKEWTKGKQPYFCTPNIFNGFGTDRVYNAKVYMRNFFTECNKLSCFNQYNRIEDKYDDTRLVSQMHYLMRSAKINEMLEKSGLKSLADNHLNYYMYRNGDHTYSVNNRKTTINEVLKLSKHAYNIWKQNADADTLTLYQKWSNKFSPEYVAHVIETERYYWQAGTFLTNLAICMKLINKDYKVIQAYCDRKEIKIQDYMDYLKMLNNLGYDMTDKQYIMPRNFAKDKRRVCEEDSQLHDAEWLKQNSAKSAIIKLISDGLKKMPEIQKYTSGSNGLLVYVPDSAADLLYEGRALHNCIKNYTDRVAQNKTLVFYIRQMSNPDAPFVAMEYCNGQIIQCRYDDNVDVASVDNDISRNVIEFTNEFANALREAKVMVS